MAASGGDIALLQCDRESANIPLLTIKGRPPMDV
ncbi:MAG: hypothetical protein QOC63_2164, partial [Mycobacterium sp.]|nr:hypothetical protein [Mycobacterium sp.]